MESSVGQIGVEYRAIIGPSNQWQTSKKTRAAITSNLKHENAHLRSEIKRSFVTAAIHPLEKNQRWLLGLQKNQKPLFVSPSRSVPSEVKPLSKKRQRQTESRPSIGRPRQARLPNPFHQHPRR